MRQAGLWAGSQPGLATQHPMSQHTHQIFIPTQGKGLYPFTRPVTAWVRSTGVSAGLLTVFIQHTSASLVIQENADPDVVLDLRDFFERSVPEGDPRYRHTAEGDDDMPAHIRAALTQTSLSIPVIGGRMALGTWQGLYVFEHRSDPSHRSVVLHLMS
jgi:secondary thiamine-phosphate synthase enzyme